MRHEGLLLVVVEVGAAAVFIVVNVVGHLVEEAGLDRDVPRREIQFFIEKIVQVGFFL